MTIADWFYLVGHVGGCLFIAMLLVGILAGLMNGG